MGVKIVVEVGVQQSEWGDGWMGGWVVRKNESNTKLNSIEVVDDVVVELGQGPKQIFLIAS